MMKINGEEINGTKFAYDMCHKIYVIEDEEDERIAREAGYNIYPIERIEEAYNKSCPLKFINNWKLDKTYVEQMRDKKPKFEEVDED